MKPQATAPRTSRPVKPPRAAPAQSNPRDAVTPAMRQYQEQKSAVPDALLLFRMGDFYETFYDDAKTLAAALGLTLTTRDKNSEHPVPLAGIPYHALDRYVARLVRAGYKVAISEQIEDPRLTKGLVKREIVRIITPGTLTEEALLDDRADNYLAAVCMNPAVPQQVGLALVELASGRFFAQTVPLSDLSDELARINPAEVLAPESDIDQQDTLQDVLAASPRMAVSRRPRHCFDPHEAKRLLCEHFGVTTLEGFGFERIDASLCAAAAVIEYLRETQKTSLAHIRRIVPRCLDDRLIVDQVTLRSLEVERTLRDGAREGSLLAAVDLTVNPMGARRLRHWLSFPLREVAALRARQLAVAALLDRPDKLRTIRDMLRDMSDIERILSRVALGRASPRDLAGLGRSLARCESLANIIQADARAAPPNSVDLLRDIADRLSHFTDTAALLESAIVPDAPPSLREPGFIAPGHHAELDRFRALQRDGHGWLAEYQAAESNRTGIPTLKIDYNSVFGYYIEITHQHRDKIPPDYVRKQTVRNAERYITDALKKFENDALAAEERAKKLELDLFDQLCAVVREKLAPLQHAADHLANLDVLASFAEAARLRGYCRPEFNDDTVDNNSRGLLEIIDGRHPVLDVLLGERFVPNDCTLQSEQQQLLILTGPNMAGKSTYIRQVALLTLLAHTGAYVPAKSMRLAPCDRIFARVGASDELARGQSTFMVEMIETARILHNATASSLVILDEIGRGTSTYDGLAIAWAVTEYLATHITCRTLFATHYHELTQLADQLPCVANYNVAVREALRPDGVARDVVFLHKIVPGPTDRSYGLHVASMAGLPPSIIARGETILAHLESTFTKSSRTPALHPVSDPSSHATDNPPPAQLSLFDLPPTL